MLEKHRRILEMLKKNGITVYKFNEGPSDGTEWKTVIGKIKVPFPVNAEKLLHGEELGVGDEHLQLQNKSS